MSDSQAALGKKDPLQSNDLHDMRLPIDVVQRLSRAEEAVVNLKEITHSHSVKIDRLDQWTAALPTIEKDVAQNTKDLNELGKRCNDKLSELDKRQERGLNDLGIRLGNNLSQLEKRHDTEIGNLNHLVDTARWAGRVAWGAITLAALVASPFVYAVFVHIYRAVQKLLF
jgi:hypothetical protein